MEQGPANLETGEPRLGPGYRYLKEIGRGGYGYVYLFNRLAEGSGEEEYVAGKFVYRQAFGPPEDGSTFAGYQRAIEGLENFRSLTSGSPYLLRIFDVQQRHEEGYFCYSMELADDLESGRMILAETYKPRSLKAELERSGQRCRLPAVRCVEISIHLARGLQILHESGFTHRDVRPANIIFVRDVPKLADIDLLAEDNPALTSYIPRNYAAPEGGHSSRADIFSFGKTLYEMCTGLPVQAFPSLPADIRHWEDHRLLLELNKIIARSCVRDLRRRYASAEQMLKDLESIYTS